MPSPAKDMLFDPKESLSFNGNTGPYLQYMGARISSMIRKAGDKAAAEADFSLMVSDPEWELIKILAVYPSAVTESTASLDPSRLASYLYELSKCFSRFHHECPILTCGDPAMSNARLELSRAVMLVLKDAFNLVCIPFLEVM
jgi:arginyl-tRNA synthetase